MADVLKPSSEEELAHLIASAEAPFAIHGTASKAGFGRPVEAQKVLDLSEFSGILNYEPEELIMEAGAGTPLAEIEREVMAAGQQLAFEPPDFSGLYGSAHGGTLGGVFSCNLSGPRRIKSGAARDHVLGARGVTGRGEPFKAGARVVKNVTGYDLPKLFTGSHGTLAALTSVTFKVLPKPESEETLVIAGLDDGAAIKAMGIAMQSVCDVSGAAHVPQNGTYLRLEGIAPSIAYRRQKLKDLLKGEIAVLPAGQSAALWKSVRDGAFLKNTRSRIAWRISVAPSEGAAVMERIRSGSEAEYYYDWAGGLIWLSVPMSEDASVQIIRGAISGGHATLMRAPETIRSQIDVFQPHTPALAALTARIKVSFDPQRLLNPGRMYRGI